jgi:hypothetical protein
MLRSHVGHRECEAMYSIKLFSVFKSAQKPCAIRINLQKENVVISVRYSTLQRHVQTDLSQLELKITERVWPHEKINKVPC